MASHKRSEDPLFVKDRQDQECDSSDSTIASENTSEHRSPMGLIDEDGIETLNRIASQSSRRRSSVYPPNVPTRTSTLATISENDPAVDPQGPSFDLNKWLKMVLRESERQGREGHRTGIVFKNFTVSGTGAALQLQDTVSSMLSAPFRIGEMIKNRHSPPKRILNEFNGLLKSGELLLVLGRPGSGCSTFLKSLCGELHGLSMSKESVIHYDGVPQQRMIKEFKGEVVYNQEVDKHFPHLTVGQTLEFAALARTPAQRIRDMSREEFAKHITQVVMAVFGLSHTYNTKVGNDFVRGVSGGERKRVSIAEMALAHSPLAAWDNSTRGLDSATALKFVEALRLFADLSGSAHAVAIYQASQSIYDIFNKVVVLYEGRQIYYGPAKDAKSYFERQGWECPQRQTTGDFLTSVTNPSERKARPGMENQVPRTAEDFEAYWRKSPEYQKLMSEISHYEQEHPLEEEGAALATFQQKKREIQAKHTRPQSPYLLSVPMQIKLNTKRAYQRVWNDISSTVSTVISQIIMALIIGSVFYGTPDATAGFTAKGATLFFAVLLNALIAMNEINSLYSQRPIVEKHNSYAFYHPATEAIAGVVSDIPVKFVIAVVFNLILYFMAGLHRSAGQFFLYLLVTFIVMFVMSAVFRTMAAITQTVSQAMGLAGILILALVVYTGFVLPVPSMHPWFEWIHYLNPIYYAFEMLIANEFHGRDFICSQFIPAYPSLSGNSFVCSSPGAKAGQRAISGDDYIQVNYQYSWGHVWRNFGILIAFLVGFMVIYFIATELNSATSSTAEVLVFRRGHEPAYLRTDSKKPDAENAVELSAMKPTTESGEGDMSIIPPQKDIFTWRDVCYDIEIKGEPRRLLDHVSGWVKPGTLTALMGVSGAGKTTLLDVLAHRTSMGVITGDMFVNGRGLDQSFQRSTGYVQQQDLHLETATVRESLRFSALLRQPPNVSIQEKYDYVEDVIRMLKMEDFAEAVVGVPGQGLNVEQRKLLTIGVELAAKPKLLLFLDEPTSGLDSQSSWAICAFLRRLADSGQAVLCTIHQPSAILFQQFDQLLFLARGGKTVYFGPIGQNSNTLLNYFESNGARKCADDENPAEWMLEIVNAGKNSEGENWFDVWKRSSECQGVQTEIDRIHREQQSKTQASDEDKEAWSKSEFAMPFWFQLYQVTYRVFQQYWRMPEYIAAKWMLGILSGLFIGFSFFQAKSSLQGMQTIVYSLFMLCTIFSSLVQQVMPLFVTQRSLYEVRERPSKTYSWKAFLIANIIVEIPYQIMMGILTYACYYYAVVGVQDSERQGLVLLLCIQFFIYASTFAHMAIAAMPDTETASAIVVLLFAMSLTFCGVMQTPTALPGFWIFMYRVSPFTYWVSAMASTQLHGRVVQCSPSEMSIFDPPSGQTCGEYMSSFMSMAGGQLSNPNATSDCNYCSVAVADDFLSSVNIYWSERWRNFGLMWVYIVFNIFLATMLYYMFRVKKWNLSGLKERFSKKK
ncbi:ABC-2 type transporter-domain-containing protein [Aspergillus transmontanensis]|uniref:ABC-2 type transporter-domain-containing protein n=1 Tax=Aspergillus transmontanensis TaxID=1034304 RepID=A0A5N6VZ22_9EURO|nr:ABC-2 type transporter-domain-containing protein [Aspergillus transmontanensis]